MGPEIEPAMSEEVGSQERPIPSADVAVSLRSVTKKFGEDVVAVNKVDLDIRDGEFFSLLGPSGCGKTTTLRIIAGLEFPTDGSVQVYGEEMALRPPNKRPINTVFQSYALFPHMNVEDNIGFGLRMQKVDTSEVRARVGEAIDLVRLTGLNNRRPGALSGGQQQRVALARALVNRPKVLLLDEPLGALDLKLRQTMQFELKDIQADVGITFVYVTHDQEEALTMSDRIGVMNEGELAQVGTSDDIYESPSNLFVSSFVGEMNFLPAEIAEPGSVRLSDGEVVRAKTNATAGTKVTLTLRPEKLHLFADINEVPPNRNALRGTVARKTFFGDSLSYEVHIGQAGSVDVRVENIPVQRRWDVGDEVVVDFHPEAATALAK